MWAVGDDMDVEATGRWRHSSWPVLVGDSGSSGVKMVSGSFALPVMSCVRKRFLQARYRFDAFLRKKSLLSDSF